MRILAAAVAALVLVAPARGDAVQDAVRYLSAEQRSDGGFGSPGLTAWAVLGLRAAGAPTGVAADYLAAHEDELTSATDVELGLLAERALGRDATRLVARLRGLQQASGAIGPTLSSTFWGDRKSTRLNSSHSRASRMPSSA